MARGRIVDILRYVLRLDTGSFDKDSKKADAQVNRLGAGIGKLGKLVSAAAIAFGLFKLGQFALDLAKVAARTEVLDTVLDQVAKTTNTSKNHLIALREEMKSLGITTQEATGSLVKFLGNDLPIERINELADAARNVAVVMGTNTSQAFAVLTRAIITQNTVLLKNAGLSIDLEAKYAQFAKTAGIVGSQVTRAEKRMIVFNAVMERAAPLAGAYEAAMTNVGKRITSLPRLIEEASNAVGRFFVPALGAGVDAMAGFLKFIQRQFAPGIEVLRADIAKISRDLKNFEKQVPKLDALRNEFVELAVSVNAGVGDQERLNEVIAELDKILPGISLLVSDYADDLDSVTSALDRVIAKQTELRQAQLLDIVESQAKEFKRIANEILGIAEVEDGSGFASLTNLHNFQRKNSEERIKLLAKELAARLELANAPTPEAIAKQPEFANISNPLFFARQRYTEIQEELKGNLAEIVSDLKDVGDAFDESQVQVAFYNNRLVTLNAEQDSMIDNWARLFPNIKEGSTAYTLLAKASKEAGLGMEFVTKVIERQSGVASDKAAKAESDRQEKFLKDRDRKRVKLSAERKKLVSATEKELTEIRLKATQAGAEAEFEIALSTLIKIQRKELQAAGAFATERGRLEAEINLKFLEERKRRAFQEAKEIGEVNKTATIESVHHIVEARRAIQEKFNSQERQAAQEQADALSEIRSEGVTLEVEDTNEAIARLTAQYDTGAISISDYTAKVRDLLEAEKLLIEASVDGDLILLSQENAERLSDVVAQLQDLELAFVAVKDLEFSAELAQHSAAYQSGATDIGEYKKAIQRTLKTQISLLKSLQLITKSVDIFNDLEDAIQDLNNALRDTDDILTGIKKTAGEVADILRNWSFAIGEVDSGLGRVANSGARFAQGIATQNTALAIGGAISLGKDLVDMFSGIFSGGQSVDEQFAASAAKRQEEVLASQDRLRESLDNLRDVIANEPISQSVGIIEDLKRIDFLFAELRQGSAKLGGEENFNILLIELNRLLSQFGLPTAKVGFDDNFDPFLLANEETLAKFRDFFAEILDALRAEQFALEPFESAGTLDAFAKMAKILKEIAKLGGEQGDIGLGLIRFWTEYGDLSLEQQRELLELLIAEVGLTNDITFSGLENLKLALKLLNDKIAAQEESGDPELSQVRRSVTTITESQANLMTSTLNSMLLVLHEINNSMRSFLDRAADSVAPSIQTIFNSGAIQVTNNNQFFAPDNVNDVTVSSIEEQLKQNARNVGIK